MIRAKIRVKNYRCFGQAPQEIIIRSGFTAFIGSNNSGKSAILKMFYELRPVWQHLSTTHHLGLLHSGPDQSFRPLGLADPEEIFNHYNSHPIEILFDLSSPDGVEIQFSLHIPRPQKGVDPSFNLKLLNINSARAVPAGFVRRNGETYLIYTQEGISGNQSLSVNFLGDFFSLLTNSMYIPAFRNVINAGEHTKHYDIATGTAFIRQWDDWKAGNIKFARSQITKITEDIKNLFGYRDMEIVASTDKTTLRLTINGKSYSLSEVGSGLSQFILTFASAAIRSSTLIFIDEPELNLHPSLQLKFLTSLASYSSEGVVFATHSIGLARSAAEHIYSVTNNGIETKISSFSNTPDLITLLGELSFSTYREIGADAILFVEGPTEIKTMQEFLRKFGKDGKLLVISLGGADMINGKRKDELNEIVTRLKVKNIYAWIDSEKTSFTDALATDRAEFIQVCKDIGIKCKVSERRSIENYFTERSVRNALNDRSKLALGEYDLLNQGINWRKNENWKIAKEMTRDEVEVTDLGQFLIDLKV